MKKINLGLILGTCAAIIDLIIMLIQRITWDANLSAFSLWIISGFFIATSNLNVNKILKGIIISFLILLPNLFLIAWKEPISLIPIITINICLGALLGYFIK